MVGGKCDQYKPPENLFIGFLAGLLLFPLCSRKNSLTYFLFVYQGLSLVELLKYGLK